MRYSPRCNATSALKWSTDAHPDQVDWAAAAVATLGLPEEDAIRITRGQPE
jgi:hypothetical protein